MRFATERMTERLLTLRAPKGTSHDFTIKLGRTGGWWTIGVAADGSVPRSYRIRMADHGSYSQFYRAAAADMGLYRVPPADERATDPRLRPLLTANVHKKVLYGYGDPAVLRADDAAGPLYHLIVTSNDAPDAFPILHSRDLDSWSYAGCAFPAGTAPAWAATGRGIADFWAPELHRVGEEYWLCFTARTKKGTLAIGLARAAKPTGPWIAPERPLLEGDVIDAHIFAGGSGAPILFWKEDRNGAWPPLLLDYLKADPGAIAALFPDDEQRRTASFFMTLVPWTRTLQPMERFIANHGFIEMVAGDFAGFRRRLRALADRSSGSERRLLDTIAEALTTKVFAQPLRPDGSALTGRKRPVLQNDQGWEAHLIEGPWVHAQDGHCYLFYAGNDFSTDRYGIGCAVADAPTGPYRKLSGPFLRSSREWLGPGHPSVAVGLDGTPRLFFHAYHPSNTGYGAFRAMLSTRLRLSPTGVEAY